MSGEVSAANAFNDDCYCLCCGEKNPLGFKMKFRYEGEKLLSETVIPKEYQGFADVAHGGVLGTLLDELMVNLYWLNGEKAVTAVACRISPAIVSCPRSPSTTMR